jgi:RHS repeat-associated protein
MKQFLLCTLIALASLNASLSQAYDRVTYIHSNGQGTPVAASDELGNVEWRAEYYPFGGEYSQTEIRRENNIGYSGKALDEEIGLIYFGARYYDPQVGRFTSIDPAKVTAQNYYSFNRYSYVNNNPYKYVDPNGEFPFLIPIAIFIAKEVAAELASRATGGATDFLSFRRMGTKAAKSVAKSIKAGGGAKIDNVPEVARDRIQGFADKYDTDVTLVGSRAKKRGGNNGDSDWDYIIPNPPGKLRKRGKRELPKGRAGGELGSGQDFLPGPVNNKLPHITFSTKGNGGS